MHYDLRIRPCVFGCHAVVFLSLKTLVHCGDKIFESVKPKTTYIYMTEVSFIYNIVSVSGIQKSN